MIFDKNVLVVRIQLRISFAGDISALANRIDRIPCGRVTRKARLRKLSQCQIILFALLSFAVPIIQNFVKCCTPLPKYFSESVGPSIIESEVFDDRIARIAIIQIQPSHPRLITIHVSQAVEMISPKPLAHGCRHIHFQAKYLPIIIMLKILSGYPLTNGLNPNSIIHLYKQPSETLQSKITDINQIQLVPKSQRGEVDDIDLRVDVPRGLQYFEVEPIVVVYSRFVIRIGQVSKVTHFQVDEVRDLGKFWELASVEIAPGVREVVHREVADRWNVSLTRACAPGIVRLRCKHHPVQNH